MAKVGEVIHIRPDDLLKPLLGKIVFIDTAEEKNLKVRVVSVGAHDCELKVVPENTRE